MSTIAELSDALKSLDVMSAARQAGAATTDSYTQANRDQMLSGKRKDGRKVMDAPGDVYAWETYALEKNRMNSKPGMYDPDLNCTGAFHASMKAVINQDSIEMTATDSKAEKLEAKYGEDIYGIGGEFLQGYADNQFTPEFQKIITNETGLKFN